MTTLTAWQATCVSLDGRGLLIEGPPGSGKSTLALELIDRGALLVGDDSVLLDSHAGQLIARPHPATRGLLELRNIGLLRFAVADGAPVALVIRLDPLAPRYVEQAATVEHCGITVPLLTMAPGQGAAAIRAECALAAHGAPPGPPWRPFCERPA